MNILITGGSSGLGKEVVNTLSQSPNNKVYFTYNRHGYDAEVMMKHRENVIAINCDFTKDNDICELMKRIPEIDIDVLINNAYVGAPQGAHFHKMKPESFLKSFEENLIPTVKITQQAIREFRKKKFGKIINILTAYLVNVPPIGFSIYSANKAYLMQLSKSWSNEYSRYNITSNCISPEFMLTNLSGSVDERVVEQLQAKHPLKKLLTPTEVADAVSYIVNTSQQLNGAHIIINAAQNIS